MTVDQIEETEREVRQCYMEFFGVVKQLEPKFPGGIICEALNRLSGQIVGSFVFNAGKSRDEIAPIIGAIAPTMINAGTHEFDQAANKALKEQV